MLMLKTLFDKFISPVLGYILAFAGLFSVILIYLSRRDERTRREAKLETENDNIKAHQQQSEKDNANYRAIDGRLYDVDHSVIVDSMYELEELRDYERKSGQGSL